MAPPRKRRRLSDPDPQSFTASRDAAHLERTPPFTHSVSDLKHHPELPELKFEPKRIEEIHLQIHQQSAVVSQAGQFQQADLRRRQIESIITTTNAAGSTIVTTTIATIGNPGPSSSAALNSSSSSSSSSSTGAFPSLSVARNSSVPVTTHHTTHTTTLPLVYTATLTNHHVKTITRLSLPYATTFGDGQTSTICNRFGQCKVAATHATSKSTKTTTPTHVVQTHTTASQAPSSAAAVVSESPSSTSPNTPSSSSASVSHHTSSHPSTPPSTTIAGGVVGGFAGITILLLIALAFMRWYKRRAQNGHHALPPSSRMTPDTGPPHSSGASAMVERAGLAPLVNAVPALFRHQNRSQEEPATAAAAGERGFTKVSGRKLPSAFSEGMTRGDWNGSPPPNAPLNRSEQDLTGTSFYRDSNGFYGGSGGKETTWPNAGAGTGSHDHDNDNDNEHDPSPFADQLAPTAMTLSPGPQRRPTIHAPGPYVITSSSSSPQLPGHSDRSAAAPMYPPPYSGAGSRSETPPFRRSETPSTLTDNRSSRFMEDV